MNLGLRLFFGEFSFVDRIFFDMTRKNEVDSVMMLFSVIKKYPKIKKTTRVFKLFRPNDGNVSPKGKPSLEQSFLRLRLSGALPMTTEQFACKRKRDLLASSEACRFIYCDVVHGKQ